MFGCYFPQRIKFANNKINNKNKQRVMLLVCCDKKNLFFNKNKIKKNKSKMIEV